MKGGYLGATTLCRIWRIARCACSAMILFAVCNCLNRDEECMNLSAKCSNFWPMTCAARDIVLLASDTIADLKSFTYTHPLSPEPTADPLVSQNSVIV